MEIGNILSYLENKGIVNNIKSCEKITVGAGGAKLFKICTDEKELVLKIAPKGEEAFDSYHKEYEFYKLNEKLLLPLVPKIHYAENHPEYGILLLMQCLRPIAADEWDITKEKKAMDLCARLNALPAELFEPLGIKWTPNVIDENFTRNSYNEWLSVIGEHGGRFDENILSAVYKNIGKVCEVLNSPPHFLCHGDFHPENLLTDGEKLYMCDFQGLGIGKGIGDAGFFISRGTSMGIDMEADTLLYYYAERLSEYMGKEIKLDTLLRERSASTLLFTFSFWASYLHGATYENAEYHFNEMADAAKILGMI